MNFFCFIIFQNYSELNSVFCLPLQTYKTANGAKTALLWTLFPLNHHCENHSAKNLHWEKLHFAESRRERQKMQKKNATPLSPFQNDYPKEKKFQFSFSSRAEHHKSLSNFLKSQNYGDCLEHVSETRRDQYRGELWRIKWVK